MNFINPAVEPIGYNNELNPKIWHDGRIKPEVRSTLLKIAKDFKEFIDIPIRVKDIIIAGAQANYTYTKYSDLDLHLVVDYKSVPCDREVAELFDSKRLLFKRDHDIKIYDIPIEPGVEDLNNPTVGAAYSILNQEWIKKPNPNPPRYDPEELNHMVKVWTTILDAAVNSKDLNRMRKAQKLLRRFRKLGLKSTQGEFSIANLVYKSLRNSETTKRLQTTIDKLHDQQLSIGD